MKQSTTTSRSKESSLLASATEDEIIVSQILLDLRNLMSLTESLANFNWGRRKRRSCLDAAPPLPPAPSWPSPLVQRTGDGIEERKPPRIQAEVAEVAEEKGCAARTTASPDTPLSFSPSESDEKSKHSSKKTSKKRSREECLDMIEGYTQRNDLFRGEIENVKKHLKKLKAENSQLKAIKREPLIGDPTAHTSFQYHPFGPIKNQMYSSANGLGTVNHVGPLGFDLNIPAEEAFGGVDPSQPSDALADRRARFAEARRMRRGIIKIKSMRSACGIKLPTN